MTGTPAGNIYCLAGNLGAALLDLGFGGDERLMQALELMARFVTGEGVAPRLTTSRRPLRYLKSGACGPGFRCSANNRLPCAWGAVKVLRALARVPEAERTPRHAGCAGGRGRFPVQRGPRHGRLSRRLQRQAQPELVPVWLPRVLCHRRAADRRGADRGRLWRRPAPGRYLRPDPEQAGRGRPLEDGILLQGQDLGRCRGAGASPASG